MLRVKAAAGRLFLPKKTTRGPEVALVSHALWLRHLAAGGSSVNPSGSMTKICRHRILPAAFSSEERHGSWIPAAFSKREMANRDAHYLTVAARLKPRVTLPQAGGHGGRGAPHRGENPDSAEVRVIVVPLREQLPAKSGPL